MHLLLGLFGYGTIRFPLPFHHVAIGRRRTKLLVGCYDGWADANEILYLDCGSDIGYANFQWEYWKLIGNGGMSASGDVYDMYSFDIIRRCNTFLENINNVEFEDEAKKNDMIGQVRTIRAYQYFDKNWWYGGNPIIENYETAEEAQVPRNTKRKSKNMYIMK